jgi:UDP-N-acetylmuramate dehydrogenase
MNETVLERVMVTEETALLDCLKGYPGLVKYHEPMAPYTTLHLGGPADAMVFPNSVEQVAELMHRLSKTRIPFFVIGNGSNLLVSDLGIEGIVIHMRDLNQLILSGNETVSAEAGFSYPKLSAFAQKQGLTGLEFAAGIPGTVGGAVAMNAGIPHEETESIVREVKMVNPEGQVIRLSREALSFSYRSVSLPPGIIVSAELALRTGSLKEIEKKRIDLMKRRRETQPLSYPNAGSIFKNPPSCAAGQLVEEVQLKGYQMGGAQISEKHGNFIINLGGATAKDLAGLIQLVQERVFLAKGISLETEVKWVGRW